MKKIIIFGLFVIIATGCVAQNYEIFTNVKNTVESYETYLTNGNFRKAGQLEDDLLRWNTWLMLSLFSSAEDEADSMNYAIDKLDDVSGVTLLPPSYTYDATGAVYISGTPTLGQLTTWTNANTVIGKDSLLWHAGRLSFIGKGTGNMSMGYGAGAATTTGTNSTNIGILAGNLLTIGGVNTNIGSSAGAYMTSAHNNTNVGGYAGQLITTGDGNTNTGAYAGSAITTGEYNSNLGLYSGKSITTGGSNSNFGHWAGYTITTGSYNSNFGREAGVEITTGNYNNNFGNLAGYSITTGSQNVNIGYGAGAGIEEGSNNINIGDSAGYGYNDSHNLFIESSGANKFNALIWGDFANDSLRLNATVKVKTDLEVRDTTISDMMTAHITGHDSVTGHNTRILANLGFIEDNQDSITSHNTRILANLTDIENEQDTTTDMRSDIEDLQPSGSQYAVQLSNGDGTFTSDASFTIQSDSLMAQSAVLSGGLRLTKWGTTDTAGLYKLPNGTVDTMEWVRSSWASYKENLEPFDVFFQKRDLLGELNWPRWKGDSYHKINPMYANTQFSIAFERTWVYIEDLYDKNKKLEDRISVLETIIKKEYKLTKRQLRKLNEN